MTLSTTGASGNASLTNNHATVLAASSVGGSLAVTDQTAGSITQTGVLTVGGTSSFTNSVSGQTITLGSNNLLTGVVSLNTTGASSNATLVNAQATNLGASTVGGNLTVTDKTAGSITQTDVLTVGGTSSFTDSVSGQTITLTQANLLTGAVTLNTTGASGNASLTNDLAGGTTLGTSTVGGSLTVVNTLGNLSQTAGILTVTGVSSFTDSASNATITLGSANALTGAVTLSTTGASGNASLTNNHATVLAASSVGGNLAVTNSTGNLTQTGVLTVGGTSSFTTSASNATITLTQANLLTGAVTLNTTGASGNASLTNDLAGGTTLGTSTVGGSLTVTTTGTGSNLTLGGAVTAGTTVTLTSAGTITQSSGVITATTLTGSSVGGATLNDANLVTNLGAFTNTSSGALNFIDAQSLATTATVSSPGALTLITTGTGSNLTLNSGTTLLSAATGNAIVLSAIGNFVNSAGASVISLSGGGRWLVYSNAPGTDTFGTLNSGNTAIWNATYTSLPPGNVTQSGDLYLFANQPTLTFTTTNTSKTYGSDATAAVAAAYSVSGYQSGVSNAFLADNAASIYSGTPAVTSTGSVETANVAGSPYAVTATTGSLSALNGYAFAFVNTGTLTVNPAALTITASPQSTTYGTALNLGTTAFTTSGTQNGENVTAVTLTSNGSATVAGTLAAGTYSTSPNDITPSAATGTGGFLASNYNITYTPGTLTVNPVALTITASPQSTTYGRALNLGTTAFTTSGTQNGENVTAVTLTSNGSATVAGTLAAGTYSTSPNDITPSAATGTGGFLASNYNITYTPGTLTVNPAALTITASLVNTMVDGVSISDALSRAQYGILAGEQVGSYLTDQCGLPRRQITECQSHWGNCYRREFPGRKATNANLTNANLSNSNFQGAILQNAIVTGAIFTGSYFAGTNFQGTGYSGKQLAAGRSQYRAALHRAIGKWSLQRTRSDAT